MIPRVRVARTFLERTLGLSGRIALPGDEALYLPNCRAVHTCFMRFSLDIRFLDKEGKIVRTVYSLPPWRWAWGGPQAVDVLETEAGRPAADEINTDQPLCLA